MTLVIITERPSLDPRLMWAFVTMHDADGRKISEAVKCGTGRQVSAWLAKTVGAGKIVQPEDVELLRAVNDIC